MIELIFVDRIFLVTATLYTVEKQLRHGNDEDEKIVGRFFDLIEQNMTDFIALNKDRP